MEKVFCKKLAINLFLSLVFAIIVIVSPIMKSYATTSGIASDDIKIRGVTLLPSAIVDIPKIQASGFNTVFLSVDSIRSVKKPYSTNYHALRQLYKNVQALERAKLKYVLCFTSGPGYSSDFKTSSIYSNKAELRYFTQMVNEVLSRYSYSSNLAGVSINFTNPDVDYKKYYAIQESILKNVQTRFSQLPCIYNLQILTFEENLSTLPEMNLKKVIVSLPISLNALNYPGYGAGQKTSCTMDKNALLSSLEKLDAFSNKYKLETILSIKTPWVKNSEVMLQDIFELLKMLKLDYSLSYGNSGDRYDFSSNNNVIKVVRRYNK